MTLSSNNPCFFTIDSSCYLYASTKDKMSQNVMSHSQKMCQGTAMPLGIMYEYSLTPETVEDIFFLSWDVAIKSKV